MTREKWMAWVTGALLLLIGQVTRELILTIAGAGLLVTIAILAYISGIDEDVP
jgi:hypothetical protein